MKGVFYQCVRYRAHDGQGIKFWHDEWCGQQVLSQQFPNLYLLDRRQLAFIADQFEFRGPMLMWPGGLQKSLKLRVGALAQAPHKLKQSPHVLYPFLLIVGGKESKKPFFLQSLRESKTTQLVSILWLKEEDEDSCLLFSAFMWSWPCFLWWCLSFNWFSHLGSLQISHCRSCWGKLRWSLESVATREGVETTTMWGLSPLPCMSYGCLCRDETREIATLNLHLLETKGKEKRCPVRPSFFFSLKNHNGTLD